MRWFNAERLKNLLTFPVETANMHTRPLLPQEVEALVLEGKAPNDAHGKIKRVYADAELANFFAEM